MATLHIDESSIPDNLAGKVALITGKSVPT